MKEARIQQISDKLNHWPLPYAWAIHYPELGEGTIDWSFANNFSKTESEWQHVAAEIKPTACLPLRSLKKKIGHFS